MDDSTTSVLREQAIVTETYIKCALIRLMSLEKLARESEIAGLKQTLKHYQSAIKCQNKIIDRLANSRERTLQLITLLKADYSE